MYRVIMFVCKSNETQNVIVELPDLSLTKILNRKGVWGWEVPHWGLGAKPQ